MAQRTIAWKKSLREKHEQQRREEEYREAAETRSPRLYKQLSRHQLEAQSERRHALHAARQRQQAERRAAEEERDRERADTIFTSPNSERLAPPAGPATPARRRQNVSARRCHRK